MLGPSRPWEAALWGPVRDQLWCPSERGWRSPGWPGARALGALSPVQIRQTGQGLLQEVPVGVGRWGQGEVRVLGREAGSPHRNPCPALAGLRLLFLRSLRAVLGLASINIPVVFACR